MPPSPTPNHKALHTQSESETNVLTGVRLVSYTPPRLPGHHGGLYSRTPLPTLRSHFLPPTTRASYQGSAFALEQSESDVSANPYPENPQATPGSSVTTTHQSDQSRPSTATSTRSKPLAKKRKHVALNPDNKTFRVLDSDRLDEAQTDDGLRSSSSLSPSSHDFLSFGRHDLDTPTRSPASCTTATTPTTSAHVSPTPRSTTSLSANRITNSPWNYQFVGGLRKVPKTPDLKQKAASSSESPLPSLPDTSADSTAKPDLSTKPSFQSTLTASTTSENSNYKVYGSSPSPQYLVIPPPSSSDSNQQLIDESTTQSQSQQYPDLPPPSSSDSNYQIHSYSSHSSSDIDLPSENYQLQGDSSPPASYAALSSTGPRYSQESLVIPPLQPRAKRSTERFGYYKSHSRESLRTGSLTSISTVLAQEAAQAIVTSGSVIQLPATNFSTVSSSWAAPLASNPVWFHMHAHPHQWSSQLSTVPSESDAGTDRGSRSWSDGNARRSSRLPSPHSHQMASVGSSLRQEGHSRTNSLEPPQAIYVRSSPRLVEDQDEYGDGITDLQDLRLRSSRTRVTDFFSINPDNSRTNTMRSTSSSRANSLLSSSIPAWARLYYGSGEGNYLGAPGSSTEGTDSRPQSSFRTGSPDTSNFPLSIYSPRRRPRQNNPNTGRPSSNRRGSMEISPLPELGSDNVLIYNSFRRRYRPSSSILSPHLKRDRRATRGSKFFMEPASVDWSMEGNVFTSRRKRLIVMFIAGFIFPLAWMIGSFLPLPPNPIFEMTERDRSTSNLDVSKAMIREFGSIDVARYESARWWRNLNRGMAVLGFMIMAVVIVLLIVSIKQGWAK